MSCHWNFDCEHCGAPDCIASGREIREHERAERTGISVEKRREEIAAYQKKYREDHKEEMAVVRKKYHEEHREENREKVAACKKRYLEEHREERNAYRRTWRAKRKELASAGTQDLRKV